MTQYQRVWFLTYMTVLGRQTGHWQVVIHSPSVAQADGRAATFNTWLPRSSWIISICLSHFPHRWDKIPDTSSLKEERFIWARSSEVSLHTQQCSNSMAERPGWRKADHFMAARKQREQGGARDGDTPF